MNEQTNTQEMMENTEVLGQVSSPTGYYEFLFDTEEDYKLFIQDRIQMAQNDPNYKRHYTYRNRKVICWKDATFTRYTLIK